ncbi:hypothetical protein Psuf_065880 [Phytohabitans suffuscus]|uniref:Uncharacterized protein n=1 Tax=Phytohabitans suffuscus TaxID=624315 RepID=A0A6F8YSW9_9ACTN|nr:hypothetical protein Psuf_065880 [Phytohabitans suffuscus]
MIGEGPYAFAGQLVVCLVGTVALVDRSPNKTRPSQCGQMPGRGRTAAKQKLRDLLGVQLAVLSDQFQQSPMPLTEASVSVESAEQPMTNQS